MVRMVVMVRMIAPCVKIQVTVHLNFEREALASLKARLVDTSYDCITPRVVGWDIKNSAGNERRKLQNWNRDM